jgi:DNA polymerase elongation subunit (family B)
MESLVRKHRNNNNNNNDIEMQIIEWWAQDEPNDTEDTEYTDDSDNCKYCSKSEEYCRCNTDVYAIRCFGVTKDGDSITCKITGYKPYFYIKVDSSFNRLKLIKFLGYIESSYVSKYYPNALAKQNGKHLSTIVEKKDLFGFRNGKYYKYIKLVFTNYTALMKTRYLFKKPTSIFGVTNKPTKFKLYESNVEGFMRYCHIKDILMAGWIRLPAKKYSVTHTDTAGSTARTQIEVTIDRNEVISLKEKQDMARFLQASWDIEVYSHDYTFPEPQKKQNVIFQIATTYKYYGDNDCCVKHLLTLKKCEHIDDPNVIVEECKDEKDLIKRWVDTIASMDPDIFYTYNGDSFDCMYILERALMLGLAFKNSKTRMISGYFVDKLSRMTNKPAELRKEFFSSSAYGDSEFYRLYVPGRLNYDLLIHYKRGMKKYSSYKLDYIANEILKEGKHDVTARDIFTYYEEGTPEKIKKIGEYCIVDTELLQKLVDKQLILTNIMQLANVTFVPIGYLTTRGQTIKVFSQLLRKARQMDFLVPHTNFNEDSYPITLKFKEPIFDEANMGEYLEIDLGQGTKTKISAKISEIIDETTLIALGDTELTSEYYNRKITFNRKEYTCFRVSPNEDAIDDSFTGATVLEPKPGWYGKDNIAVLDFASLYPTIMISRNLCYSTFVLHERYLDIPGVKYETIAWDDKVEYKLKQVCQGVGKSGKSKGQVCGKQAFFEVENNFYCRIHDPLKKKRETDEKQQKRDVSYNYTIVQPHTDSNGNIVNKGVFPALLEELYSERKRVKKEMGKALQDGNKLLADILDSTQLAIKISLNSCYGFLGRKQGNLILKELGSIVTSVGRMLIDQSKAYAEGLFLDYVIKNNLATHKVRNKTCTNLTQNEKDNVLKKFKVS